jgi:hypothetical protein
MSQRTSIQNLKKRGVLRFDEYADVFMTHDGDTYDRSTDPTWTKLTYADKIFMKSELNEFKANEMEVHESSKKNTRFHK